VPLEPTLLKIREDECNDLMPGGCFPTSYYVPKFVR